jgi:hemerythrin-like metal-binding protein
MGIFSWDPAYSVHVPEFDKHHQKLLEILQNLHDSMMQGKAKDAIDKIFKELSDYVNYHFLAEERKMRMYKYPGLNEHILAHDKFKQKLSDLISEYKSGNLHVTGETYSFLKNWLITHIQKEDKKYSDFFRELGYS